MYCAALTWESVTLYAHSMPNHIICHFFLLLLCFCFHFVSFALLLYVFNFANFRSVSLDLIAPSDLIIRNFILHTHAHTFFFLFHTLCIIIISHVAHTWKREYLVKPFAVCAISLSLILYIMYFLDRISLPIFRSANFSLLSPDRLCSLLFLYLFSLPCIQIAMVISIKQPPSLIVFADLALYKDNNRSNNNNNTKYEEKSGRDSLCVWICI